MSSEETILNCISSLKALAESKSPPNTGGNERGSNMGNEEKILKMLEHIASELQDVKSRVSALESEVKEIRAAQDRHTVMLENIAMAIKYLTDHAVSVNGRVEALEYR